MAYDADNSLAIGVRLFEDGSYASAMEHLMPVANAGHPKAQILIANMFQSGLGVEADGKKALKWYLKVAEKSVSHERLSGVAYHNISTIYSTGMPGVVRNLELARFYRRKAALMGVQLYPEQEPE